ncbi:MAG: HAD family phosphatase [Candidatus Riflebacteria bacterium]|nr:HAD family phosphatase [Candidatus Riflebacteria bacterium]
MKSSDLVFLCDLGGVLIDLNWVSHARELFGQNASSDELKDRWLSLQSVRKYESGKSDFSDFYREFCHETGSQVGLDVFKREFAGILGPEKPGCAEVLDYLARNGCLAMLSNTNALHVEELKRTSGVFTPFARLFFSFEMGMVKPDVQIFKTVCEQLGCNPADVMFFDDSAANIAAARTIGMDAWRVDCPHEIKKIVDARKNSVVL